MDNTVLRLDMDKPIPRQRRQQGQRVRVYHKRNTTMFCSDCQLGPNEEGEILRSDLDNPNISMWVIPMGEA